MHARHRSLEIEFDFVDHVLAMRTTDGEQRTVALEPRTVASFYGETINALAGLGIELEILGRPVEITDATPFAEDTSHAAYDGDAVERFWRALVEVDRLFDVFRGRFVGKASPVHFFWGALDLATTRFSGRPAPQHPGGAPNCADWVMHEAYSHEVSSCGFWPGGTEEGSFYSYAYPEPPGFADYAVSPDGAYYDAALGEFILPYRAVRSAADPDAAVMGFLQSTYEAAATTGEWNRDSLDAEEAHR